jgi:signal transduction histidine kinase/CheY-like chemotaxis protein
MLGYSRGEMLTLRAQDVVHPEDLAAVPLRFATIPPGGVIVSERRFVRKDGSIVHGELTTKALLDGRFQVVVRDVTERKEVQAQLLLADRMASLGRLAGGVAHEINNPLAYLTLNLEFLGRQATQLPPDVGEGTREAMRAAIDHAREGAERVRHVVRTLGAFGRGEGETIGPVDLELAIDSAVEVAALQVRRRARIVRSYEARVPVAANALRLGQVFLNLLVNARDALREGTEGQIGLMTYVRPDGRVVAEVSDDGMGIPPDVQARMFDPFFTTKPVGKGTGLGLSVCHAIVTSFGGQIACESAPGAGATFRVVLNPATELAEATPEPKPRPPETPGRVLVVDDDSRVARAMAATLRGHTVEIAGSAREALERMDEAVFDCVLCDVMMPGASGLELLDEMASRWPGMERRVVFVTGGALSAAAGDALARIENRVLEKPVGASTLRSAVASTIARRQ